MGFYSTSGAGIDSLNEKTRLLAFEYIIKDVKDVEIIDSNRQDRNNPMKAYKLGDNYCWIENKYSDPILCGVIYYYFDHHKIQKIEKIMKIQGIECKILYPYINNDHANSFLISRDYINWFTKNVYPTL